MDRVSESDANEPDYDFYSDSWNDLRHLFGILENRSISNFILPITSHHPHIFHFQDRQSKDAELRYSLDRWQHHMSSFDRGETADKDIFNCVTADSREAFEQ